MRLKILNYDRRNSDHLDWAIALRDCVNYAIETSKDMLSSLKEIGFNAEQIYISDDGEQANVDLFALTQEKRDALVVKRHQTKSIRRGA